MKNGKIYKNEMCEISDEILALLQKDIAEIKVALLGNEYNPSGGLLYRVSQLEQERIELRKDLTSLQDKYNKIVWSVGAASAVVATIISFISQFWDKLSLGVN